MWFFMLSLLSIILHLPVFLLTLAICHLHLLIRRKFPLLRIVCLLVFQIQEKIFQQHLVLWNVQLCDEPSQKFLTLLHCIIVVLHLFLKHWLDVEWKECLLELLVCKSSQPCVFLMNLQQFVGRGNIANAELLEESYEALAFEESLIGVRAEFVLVVLLAIGPHGFKLLFIFLKHGCNYWLSKDLFCEFLDSLLNLILFLLVLKFFKHLFPEHFLFLLLIFFQFLLVLFTELPFFFTFLKGLLSLLLFFDLELANLLLFLLLLSFTLLPATLLLHLLLFLLLLAVLFELLLLLVLVLLLLLLLLLFLLLLFDLLALLLLFFLLLLLLAGLLLLLQLFLHLQLTDFSQLFFVLSLDSLALLLLNFLLFSRVFRPLSRLTRHSVVLVLFLYAFRPHFWLGVQRQLRHRVVPLFSRHLLCFF